MVYMFVSPTKIARYPRLLPPPTGKIWICATQMDHKHNCFMT